MADTDAGHVRALVLKDTHLLHAVLLHRVRVRGDRHAGRLLRPRRRPQDDLVGRRDVAVRGDFDHAGLDTRSLDPSLDLPDVEPGDVVRVGCCPYPGDIQPGPGAGDNLDTGCFRDLTEEPDVP